MKAIPKVLFSALLASGAAGAAFADANSAGYSKTRTVSSPRTYTAAHQPDGKPTKVSSFAPRAGGSKRHVYGAPIQSPILRMRPKQSPASQTTPK
jgi:hypothetical protein